MSEQARIDRLAEALESALADPRARLTAADPPVDLDVAGLLRIALDRAICPARRSRPGSERISRGEPP